MSRSIKAKYKTSNTRETKRTRKYNIVLNKHTENRIIEGMTLEELIETSQILTNTSNGVKLNKRPTSVKAQMITHSAQRSGKDAQVAALRKVNHSMAVKNRKENEPSQRAIEAYRLLLKDD